MEGTADPTPAAPTPTGTFLLVGNCTKLFSASVELWPDFPPFPYLQSQWCAVPHDPCPAHPRPAGHGMTQMPCIISWVGVGSMRIFWQISTSGQVEFISTASPAPFGSLFPISRPCSPPKFPMAVWQSGDGSRDEHVQNPSTPPVPSGFPALQPQHTLLPQGWHCSQGGHTEPSCPSLEAELAVTQPSHPSPFPRARPVGKSLTRPPPPPPAYQIWPCLKRPGFLFTKKDQNWVIGCRHRCLCASLMCKQHCRALTQRRRPRHTQAPRGCHRPFWGCQKRA